MSDVDKRADARVRTSRLGDLYEDAALRSDSAPRRSERMGLGDILAGNDPLYEALGARSGTFKAPLDLRDASARDLMAHELAELTDEDPTGLLEAMDDRDNVAGRVLNALLSNLAEPKGQHRGKVGRPSAVGTHFAAWVLGSTLKARGYSQADIAKRLPAALKRLGINLRPEGAVSAFKRGQKRFSKG